MKGVRWHLWEFYIGPTLACQGVFGVLALVGTQWLRLEFFATYFYMLPMIAIIFTTVYSFSLTTIFRNLALAMNCRRKDFFWGCQLAFLITGVLDIAIMWLFGSLPRLLGLEYAFQESDSIMSGAPSYTQPRLVLFLLVICLFFQPIGAAAGSLYGKSRVWASICILVVMFLGVGGTLALLFIGDGTLAMDSTGLKTAVGIILGALCVICAGCEAYFYRSNAKVVVR